MCKKSRMYCPNSMKMASTPREVAVA